MAEMVRESSRMLRLLSLVLITILLTGCPKKIAPLDSGRSGGSKKAPSPGKTQAPVTDMESGTAGKKGLSPLQEEEIPLLRTEQLAEGEMPKETKGSPVSLTDIFFEFGQWTIRDAEVNALKQNAAWLVSNVPSNIKIEVEGHADKRGTDEYNLILGEKRAQAVSDYLALLGVNRLQLSIVSYGEERPFCTQDDEACYQENRRVHFRVQIPPSPS